MRLKISARKSDLARLQAYMVGQAILNQYPNYQIEYSFRESLGDINLTDPLWKIPEKGVFTEDFYRDLTQGRTDLVVHSWKDLPTEAKSDTEIIATLPRADQRDLLIVKKSHFAKISQAKELHLFSSSPRRAYNLNTFFKKAFPWKLEKIEFSSVRGNIQTRVRKLLENPEVDGLILAKAAMDRLLTAEQEEFSETRKFLSAALKQCQWMVLPLSVNPNAAAQGALAIEIRSDRKDLKELFEKINHQPTFNAVQKERKILSSYGGGCHQKIGVAVLPFKESEQIFLQGETDQGEKLNHPTKNKVEYVSVKANDFYLRHEIANLKYPEFADLLFVTHPDAWPKYWSENDQQLKNQTLIWCSGITTWYCLAEQGIWVNGTQDGLGESKGFGIEVLCQHSALASNQLSENSTFPKAYKLTHEQSAVTHSLPVIVTYQIEWKTNPPAIEQNIENFYWRSGMLFAHCLKLNPWLADKKHYCGPGHTYQYLKEHVKNVEILWQ